MMSSNGTEEEEGWRQSISGQHVLSVILLLAGIALIAFSFFRTDVSYGRSAWSQEQATKYQETAGRLHGLSHQALSASETDEPTVMAELKKAQAEYDVLLSQLESARARPMRVAWFMRIGGAILLAAAAGVLFLPSRGDEV